MTMMMVTILITGLINLGVQTIARWSSGTPPTSVLLAGLLSGCRRQDTL